ncbi:MAG TPA: hypothetical protein VN840_09065, partial [Streptosporangiaceae bacterium]|nr:hypothetical protein [Streptosporangiaceae bacterium]
GAVCLPDSGRGLARAAGRPRPAVLAAAGRFRLAVTDLARLASSFRQGCGVPPGRRVGAAGAVRRAASPLQPRASGRM